MSNINERIDALMAQTGVEPREGVLPIKFGTKNNVVVGGNNYLGQRFPVTLYGPSWLWLLREENIEKILSFLEDNVDTISWARE